MDTKYLSFPSVRRFLLNTAQPATTLLGKVQLPVSERLVTPADMSQLLAVAHVGDVLLTRKRLQATNLVIPGFWKHAAIYVGNGRLIEAVGDGVREIDLETWGPLHDYMICLKPLFVVDQYQAPLACKFAKALLGKPYDYLVEHTHAFTENKAFYCSEVIWWSYDQVFLASGLKSPFRPRPTLGVDTVVPQDFADAKDKWRTVWLSPQALVGS